MDKKIMKILGICLLVVGLIMFISNIRVGGFTYFRLGWGGWVLLLMGIDFILIIMKPNKIFYILMAILAILLIVSIITNMRIYMTHMSLLKWFVIAGCMFGGAGLTLKSFFNE